MSLSENCGQNDLPIALDKWANHLIFLQISVSKPILEEYRCSYLNAQEGLFTYTFVYWKPKHQVERGTENSVSGSSALSILDTWPSAGYLMLYCIPYSWALQQSQGKL